LEYLKTKLTDIINYYKQYGVLKFLKHLFNRLGFVHYDRTLIFFHMDFNNFSQDAKEPYSFHIATIDDIQKEQDYNDGWFKKEEAIQRLRNGYLLFILKDNGRMVYFRWGELKKVTINYFDLCFHIPQGFVYFAGLYVVPELRRAGIAFKISMEIINYLKKEGFKHIFSVVDPANTASINLSLKSDFKQYQTVIYKRYWFIKYYHVKKPNSKQQKRYICLFISPKNIWKTFL
jgi:ribosomal protein S18 acetylase RimI-like enzyme